MNHENRSSERRTARLIAFGVILYAGIMNLSKVASALKWALGACSPIILGLIIALILDVPMYGFEKLIARVDSRGRLNHKTVSMISLLLAAITVPVVLFVLLRFILPQFISAVTNVVDIVRANEAVIGTFIEKAGFQPDLILDKLNELGNWLTSNISMIAGTAFSTVLGMFSSVSDIVLAVILAIYVLADKAAIRRRAFRLTRAFLPEKVSDSISRCASMFISTFRTFLAMQCLEALILGALLMICMLIFRIPYALTIACMTALLALIPYVGAYLSLAIGCVLVVTISPMKALIFALVFLAAQQIEGNLIYPRVVGKSVGLPAYITLAAVMLGGAIAGIPGMFFVIPIVSVLYDLLSEAVHTRNAEKDAAEGERI